MIGLDTNVLIRFLTRDDREQAEASRKFIQRASDEKTVLFINHMVLCELTWVLKVTYNYSRESIAEVIEGILFTRQFEFEDKDLAMEGLKAYRTAKAGFADCLIGVRNRAAGCESTVTFDHATGSLDEFTLLRHKKGRDK